MLAVIMLFSSLAIWLLNLTAPSANLPQTSIQEWSTKSNIPVIWLNQKDWQGSDKLEIRFSFRAANTNTKLIQSTMAMLMSDALPLSTASINQRLSPLAASAMTYYDHENQVIGLTISNDPNYLIPALKLAKTWLTETKFKTRTYTNWLDRDPYQHEPLHELEQVLFVKPSTLPQEQFSLSEVKNYYQNMTQSVSAIYLTGDLSDRSKALVEAALNAITENFSPNTMENDIQITSVSTVIQRHHGELWQTRSAVALTPLSNVTQWLSLQIWGADLVNKLNNEEKINFVQLNLTLAPQHPWVGWNVQYHLNDTLDARTPSTGAPQLSLKSFVFAEQIPSSNDKDGFNALREQLLQQIEQNAQSPTWWAQIASQVSHQNTELTLEKFANNYREAVDNFNFQAYQEALKELFNAQTYQEIQVYQ
ncbi:hypothetical protein THO17_24050 [Marinomonas sp. THO17]